MVALPACMCCIPFACLANEGPEEGVGPPRTGITDICVPPSGY